MKKVKLSLAALTLVLAIAGTTSVNATRSNQPIGFCSSVDPNGTECLNQYPIECCQDDVTFEIIDIKAPLQH